MTARQINTTSTFEAYPQISFVRRSTVMRFIPDPRAFFPIRVPVDERRRSSAVIVPGWMWVAADEEVTKG